MNWVTLETIAEINPRKPADLDANQLCTFVPMESVDDWSARIVSPAERLVKEVERGYTYFANGDVLFAKITPCMENGKCALAHGLRNNTGFGSTEFHVIRAGDSVSPEWIYYFIRQETVRQEAKRHMTGSAGQQRVPASFVAQIEVPLPPLPEQQRIAGILSRADRLRRLRRYALEMSDGYLQSVFLEMFGDTEHNDQGWPVMQLCEIAEINPTVFIARTEVLPNVSVSFIPMASVDERDPNVVPRETKQFSEVSSGYTRFQEGDVLFAKITPCMENGKIAIVSGLPKGFGFGSTEFHILRSTSRCNRYWLLWLVRRERFRLLAMRSFTGTAGQQRVPATFLQGFMTPVPPLVLQEHFAMIAQRTMVLRSQPRESLLQAEHLFQTLLHRAFRGEV